VGDATRPGAAAVILMRMKLYLAGPLFTTPERRWNEALAERLEAAGHEVYVPHLHPAAERTATAIFHKDLEGVDWADGLVAMMDGADPDSGTCWECGYAYARGKPVVLFRGDLRGTGDEAGIPFNAMVVGAATVHIELPLATVDEAADAIIGTLAGLDR
jgi:nucleoside 2-deoxyribosyltransferase